MKQIITSYCSIRPDRVIVNGRERNVPRGSHSADEYLGLLYEMQEAIYPKFFKMDKLCKLAYLTSELLLQQSDYRSRYGGNVGVVLSNASSSLDSDQLYASSFESTTDSFPSPALFVYTLPNVMVGELCIRHNLVGENAFFITKDFNPELLCWYVNTVSEATTAGCFITGWVEVGMEHLEAILFLVESGYEPRSHSDVAFDSATLLSLYRKS